MFHLDLKHCWQRLHTHTRVLIMSHLLCLSSFDRSFEHHLVDTTVVRQVEAVLGSVESLHLQDAGGDGHGGEVDLGAGLLEAHRGVHS